MRMSVCLLQDANIATVINHFT